MSELPAVSVVIPTRDRWPLLRVTLKSALAQRGVSLEVIVVDDGSRDETAARLADFGDPRVRVLRNEAPSGVAAARNGGIAQAGAPWIAFLDDDDLWSPEKLQRQLAVAEAAGATWAYSAAVHVDEGLSVVEVVPAPSPDGLLKRLLPGNPIPAGSSNVIARTEVVRRLGGFDEKLFQIADWDLWIRLAEASRAAACDDPLVAYRVHPDNMVHRHEARVMDEIELFAAKHAALAVRHGVAVDRVRYTRWIAWARRRQGRRFSAAALYLRGAVRYRNAGNVARALGALAGERAMRGSRAPEATVDVPWLEAYRAAP